MMKNKNLNNIKLKKIEEEMKEAYIDYAMSVIIARALPDVRDGLKPVHRKILYTMLEEGLRHNAKFRKSATVVGATLGRYHPHGDIAIYDSLVRMAQDFSYRYPLIKGQGNFGSVDGDKAAAQRYTESKLSLIGEIMLKDIEKDTVDFCFNYDATRKEPVVLPSPLPQLLLNGSLGIAVGMATNIPPHNISEVCQATIYLIDHPKSNTEDLFKFIKGPDFPGGGIIYGQKDIIAAYSQGKGPIVIRGKAEIIKDKDKKQIIITEIPFQVQKSSLIERFVDLIREKKIKEIKTIRDESDKKGMRIVIELKKDALPEKILNQLYKFTDLQKTFHLNMLALVDGIQPKVLGLVELLNYFIAHRKEVILRRTKFDLKKTKQKVHILEGLFKALSKIDAIIKTIKVSKDREEAKKNLIKKFELTEIQSLAILEMRLSQLAKLEQQKIKEDLQNNLQEIKKLNAILKNPEKIKEIIKKELEELEKKFRDDRRTKIFIRQIDEFVQEDLIPEKKVIITLTRNGYIKRVDPFIYKTQKRGGKGMIGMQTLGEDIVSLFLSASTHDNLFFFTDSGKIFKTMVYEVPEGNRVARGKNLTNFLEISSQEKILSLMSLGKKDEQTGIKYLTMVTKKGIIKKMSFDKFQNIRKTGLIAIKLQKDDTLKAVGKTTSQDEIILITKKSKALRFKEEKIRPMGRSTKGIKGIHLKKDDEVISMDIIPPAKLKKAQILIITENGYGKRTDLTKYRLQNRGGIGIKASIINKKTGNIVLSKFLTDQKSLIIISQAGKIIKIAIDTIPVLGRATQGVKIMNIEKNDKVAAGICV